MVHQYGVSFEKHNSFVHADNDLLLPQAILDMDIQPQENILDHGSRNGSFTRRQLGPVALAKNCKIYAIEISKTMYALATKAHEHAKIIHVNKDLLDKDLIKEFGEDKIHKIFSLYVLMTVPDYRACLKKMNEILVKDGKICLTIVSRLDSFFKFVKHLHAHSEWAWHGKDVVVPEWAEVDYAGGNHTAVIRGAVVAAGFEVQRLDVLPRSTNFASAADCAEFLLAGTMAYPGEKNLVTEEMYKKVHKEYTDFLRKMPGAAADGSYRMDYEITTIIANKLDKLN